MIAMKQTLPVLAALSALVISAIAGVTSVKLKDGSVIKGEVSPLQSNNPAQVVVTTDFGVMRLPVEKLSDKSRKALGIGQPLSAAQYEARIAQLEAKIKALEEENARLRRAGTATAGTGGSTTPAPALRPSSLTPAPAKEPPAAAGLSYSLSSTGKRHNSRCRYYGTGRACSATDGVACKICGG
jgi:hypothetical protein